MCYSFFFFKQKTAYEMRISDWSSDVCSSNFLRLVGRVHDAAGKCEIFVARGKLPSFVLAWHVEQQIGLGIIRNKADVHGPAWRTEIIKRAAQNADGESEQHCRHGPHFRRITAWPKWRLVREAAFPFVLSRQTAIRAQKR